TPVERIDPLFDSCTSGETMRTFLSLLIGVILIAGCNDDHVTGPHSVRPAAPRGLHSTTGDHEVLLTWLDNTERNIAYYRIYVGDCGGTGCPYDPIGTANSTSFVVTGLANGQTRYFAVSAVNTDGLESDLSYDTIFDTPRPEGTGLTLTSYL